MNDAERKEIGEQKNGSVPVFHHIDTQRGHQQTINEFHREKNCTGDQYLKVKFISGLLVSL